MASRNTNREAQELKAQFETRHPGRQFRIIDASAIRTIGKFAAQDEGYEIISTNGIMVTAKVPQFNILEVRRCGCGTEILSAAIGEFGLDECDECQAKRESRQASTSKARAAQSSESVNRHVAFDEYSERGY